MKQSEAEEILRAASDLIFAFNLAKCDPVASAHRLKGAQAVGIVIWEQWELEPHGFEPAALYIWDVLMTRLSERLAQMKEEGQ